MNRFAFAALTFCVAGSALTTCAVRSDDAATTPQETTIVVTATRTPTPLSQVTSSVTVITAKQLAATGQPYVADALRLVPGLYVSSSGGPGAETDVSMRGGSTGDTLVMIDGVPINDPSTSDRSCDISALTVDNIDRIEVLRGAQSTLYGSNATAGGVNIITKRGHGKPVTHLTLDGGKYSTAEGRLDSSGSVGSWGYSASASQYYTAGFPLAALQPNDIQNDGYRNTTFSGRIDKQLGDALALDLTGRYIRATLHTAGSTAYGLADDDGLSKTDSEQITLRGQLAWQPDNSLWSSTAGASFNSINRDTLAYPNDPNDPSAYGPSNYNGRMYKLDWQFNYKATSASLLTFGAETEQDRAQSFTSGNSPANAALISYAESPTLMAPRSITTGSGFLQYQRMLTSAWNVTAGARNDDNQEFGHHTTYKIGTDYHLRPSGTTFKANFATGFKAPSLWDLYAPTYGNSKLQPETSQTYDVGVEQSVLNGRGAVSATYFNDKFDNLFGYNPATYQSINVSSAKTSGAELAASYRVAKKLDFNLNYTYTRAQYESNGPVSPYTNQPIWAAGQAFERRPGNLYAATVHYQWTPKLSFNLNGEYVGERYDYGGQVTRVTDPSYTLLNLAAEYQVTSRYKLFARIQNLTNADYQEAYSFRTAARGFYGGLTAEL